MQCINEILILGAHNFPFNPLPFSLYIESSNISYNPCATKGKAEKESQDMKTNHLQSFIRSSQFLVKTSQQLEINHKRRI